MSSDEETYCQNREKFTAERSSSEIQDCQDPDFFGPVLPPHLFKKEEKETTYGPALPEYLSKKESSEENLETADCKTEISSGNKEKILIGPTVPEHLKMRLLEVGVESNVDDDDADDGESAFGPSPSLMATGDVTCYYKPIKRETSYEKNDSEVNTKRESWMVELPATKAPSFGLGPRHFRTRVLTDKDCDRSVWTDTPADKERKKNEIPEKNHDEVLKMKRLEERDKEMERLAKKAAKKMKKKESLLEMHVKKMKKKAKKEANKRKKEGKPTAERRPFDRNIDLQVHRFDESQKRALLNKARFLNDRFAAGESKFL